MGLERLLEQDVRSTRPRTRTLTQRDFSFLAQLVYYDPLREDDTVCPPAEQEGLRFTVGELLAGYRRLLRTPKDPLKPKKASGVEPWIYDDQLRFLTDAQNDGYADWLVTDICARNTAPSQSGLYGYTVRIDAQTFAVVFRGNENPAAHLNDWRASLDIANNLLIAQHREALAYVAARADVFGGAGCTMYFVGHSLGGHIAQTCTFLAQPAVRQNIAACVTFNSPGFCDTFLERYADAVDCQCGKITNYQNENDFVSSLLTPAVAPVIVRSRYGQFNIFCNHAVSSCVTDAEGLLVPVEPQKKSFVCGGVYNWSLGTQSWSRTHQEWSKLFWMSIFLGDPFYLKSFSGQFAGLCRTGLRSMVAGLSGTRSV